MTKAVEKTESTGKRGRGAYPRMILCIAHNPEAKKNEPSIIHDFFATDDASEAEDLFRERYDLDPEIVDASPKGYGYYIAQGTGKSAVQRISITVTPQQRMRSTSSTWQAQFNGWNVFASGLKACSIDDIGEFEDDELVAVEFDSRVDKDSKISKPKMKKCEVVRFSDLENPQEMAE